MSVVIFLKERMNSRRKNAAHWWQSGQSLVEVTVASTALIFGLIAIISSLLLAVRNSSASNKQALAIQHGQEAIEVFRKFQRELGWESFYDLIRDNGTNLTLCLMTLPQDNSDLDDIQVGSCSVSSTYTGFVREADIVVNSTTQISVTVNVSWRDGPNTREVSVRQIFRDFR